MIQPTNLKLGGLLAILLIGNSIAINTNTMPLVSRSVLVAKSPPALAAVATELAPARDDVETVTDVELKKTIPRGGGGGGTGEVGLAARLKVGSYFALWYVLNIIYNSE